jgi:hypothetical protein
MCKILIPLSVPPTWFQVTADVIASELWCIHQEFHPSGIIITMALNAHL